MTDAAPASFVPCGRCGLLIEVTDPDVLEILKVRAVPMFHAMCTGEDAPMRRFKVHVSVAEITETPTGELDESGEPVIQEMEETLTALAAEAEGPDFLAAFDDLERRLGELWTKVREHGSLIDGLAEAEAAEAPGTSGPPRPALILPQSPPVRRVGQTLV